VLQHLIVQHLGNTAMLNIPVSPESSVHEAVRRAVTLINDADHTAHEGIVQQG